MTTVPFLFLYTMFGCFLANSNRHIDDDKLVLISYNISLAFLA